MLTRIKPWYDQTIEKYLVIFQHIHPNWLTLAGIIPAVIFFFALQRQQNWLAAVALIGLLFDSIDGAVARKYGKTSLFGGVLDSTLDRFVDALLTWSFVQAEVLAHQLGIAIVTAAFTTSYLRSRGGLALGDDRVLAVGIAERTERTVLLGLAFLTNWIFPQAFIWSWSVTTWVFLLLLAVSVITVFQRFFVIWQHSQPKK